MSQKRNRSMSPESSDNIFKSSPISDRSSTFVALFSPSLTAKDLQAQPDIKSATHRIAAWRKASTQRALGDQRLFDIGHDDDGEKFGGKTLGTLLALMEVEGAVVVARWYGGVMLGPVRFDHIKNCARKAISKWIKEGEMASKRLKYREEISRKDEAVRILQERDESIVVLRGLLAEKTGSTSSGGASSAIPAKVPQYSNLPLPTLEKLEHVRDATIGWILKQIEKAESNRQGCHNKDHAGMSTTSSGCPNSNDKGQEAEPEIPPQVQSHAKKEEETHSYLVENVKIIANDLESAATDTVRSL